MIKNHTCSSDSNGNTAGAKFQDATYGVGRRVMNKVNGKPGEVYRCTVCGGVVG